MSGGSTKMGVGITRHILFGQMGGHMEIKEADDTFCVWPPIRPPPHLTSSNGKASSCNHSMQRWGWFEIFFLKLSALHLWSQISNLSDHPRHAHRSVCLWHNGNEHMFQLSHSLLHLAWSIHHWFSIYIATKICSLWCFVSIYTYIPTLRKTSLLESNEFFPIGFLFLPLLFISRTIFFSTNITQFVTQSLHLAKLNPFMAVHDECISI